MDRVKKTKVCYENENVRGGGEGKRLKAPPFFLFFFFPPLFPISFLLSRSFPLQFFSEADQSQLSFYD